MWDEKTKAWLKAEQEAATAEIEVARIGQGAADPHVAELFRQARRLRDEADRLFRERRAGPHNRLDPLDRFRNRG